MRVNETARIERYLRSKGLDNDWIGGLIEGYLSWEEPTMSDLTSVITYINVNGLDTKRRFHDVTSQRAYLYHYIKINYKLSNNAIGKLFGDKNCATVLHGIRKHHTMTETGDESYKEHTSRLSKIFKL